MAILVEWFERGKTEGFRGARIADVSTMGVISPGVELGADVTPDIPLDASLVQQVTSDVGWLAWYLWGEIHYTDAFGNDRYHAFRMFSEGVCARMGRFGYAPEGNGAD
jgi:hypothetical protein